MNDLISRQVAIDGFYEMASDTDHLCTVADYVKFLESMTSAQPEIIRCKDCKHRDPEDKKCDCGHDIIWQLPRGDNWYCADARRRTE